MKYFELKVLSFLALSLLWLGQSTYGQDATETKQAETKPTETPAKLEKIAKPMLWKIVGKGENYLFGTIHVSDPRVLEMHPTARKIYENADVLFFELSRKDLVQQQNYLVLPAGTKLSDKLSQEMIGRMNKQLKDINKFLAVESLPPFKIWAWMVILPSIEAQLRDPTAVFLDMKLMDDAHDAKKTVLGLENPANQLSGFDLLSDSDQIRLLTSTLESMEADDKEKKDSLAELTELYVTGDVNKIKEYLDSEMDDPSTPKDLVPKLKEVMFDKRNEVMANRIIQALEEGPDKKHFFAAGTAHFIGEKSVIEYLEKKGIKVERVEGE